MSKKRKLTADFLELPAEKDELLRSWQSGEHSDWTLNLGDKEYRVHKVIVATGERASSFLAAAFRKHVGDSAERTDLTSLIPKPCWSHFEAVLDFIYSDTLDLKAESWGPLVKMADVLQMGSLYTKCVQAGNSFLSGKDAEKHAPRLAMDAVALQLGGQLQQEAIQIAVDLMASCFKSYSAEDLAEMPVELLQSLLTRDDLEVDNEDAIFDLLLSISPKLDKAEKEPMWRCCRLQRLSAGRLLEVALINEIPKQALVWAMAGVVHQGPEELEAPPWASRWVESSKTRGRTITFIIPNAAAYGTKKFVRSVSHRMLDRFSWRLLIFPCGTDTAAKTRETAQFVELVPDDEMAEEWTVVGVRYTITLVNWKDERKNVTKGHNFKFSNTEVDNGWHRGFLPVDQMDAEKGWLNERGELQFRAQIECRKAAVTCKGHVPEKDAED